MPSYKTMWEAARREIDTLKAEVDRLRAAIEASADDNLRELERTRQVVDLAGIARHMRVERFTPQQWKQRGHLPPVDFPDIKEPLWYASTIRDHFATATNRIWYDHPETELSSVA
jgi:hypothetical protein